MREMHPVKKNKENFPLRFEWEDAVKKFEDRKRGERIVSGNASPAEIKEAKKEAEEKTRYQKERDNNLYQPSTDNNDEEYQSDSDEEFRQKGTILVFRLLLKCTKHSHLRNLKRDHSN